MTTATRPAAAILAGHRTSVRTLIGPFRPRNIISFFFLVLGNAAVYRARAVRLGFYPEGLRFSMYIKLSRARMASLRLVSISG